MPHSLITQTHIDSFQKNGVTLVKGLFKDHVETLAKGIEANMAEPGEYASENHKTGETGRFFDDYCNWMRISEFKDVIENSDVAEVAADLMQSKQVQVFHDHVLVKEPGTSMATPWHQDSPYYFVEGKQTVSFWSPIDHVNEATLRCVAGSHLWEKPVLPQKWAASEDFYSDRDSYMPIPNPDVENMDIKEWEMEPGDAVAFNYKILHGSRGNHSDQRRRAFSVRLVGDDAKYVERSGPTSPPFPNHGMTVGQKLREDWFPIIFSR